MIHKLIYTILFVGTLFNAAAKVEFIDVDDISTWEQMLVLAKAQNKDLLVYMVPMGCKSCKELNKSTFKNKELSAFVKRDFLALKVFDFTEVGRSVQKLYNTDEEFSTIFVLNTNELLFSSITGFVNSNALIENLKVVKEKIKAYPLWQKGSVKGDLSKEDWISFLLIEYKNHRVEPDNKIITEVSTLLDTTDFKKSEVQRFILKLAIDVDGPIFQTLKSNPELISDGPVFTWPKYIKAVFDFNVANAIERKDSIYLEDVLFQVNQLPLDSAVKNIQLKGRQLYLAELGKWKAYDTITLAYLAEFPVDSSNTYQEEAMYLMEYYPQNKPQELALNYLRIGLRNKETFELYYTLGLFLFNKNDLSNAYKSAVMAYEMADKNEDSILAARLIRLIESYY